MQDNPRLFCTFCRVKEMSECVKKLLIHSNGMMQKCLIEGRKKLSKEEIRQKILKDTDNMEPQRIGTLEKTERDRILQKLKNSGLSIREIERATGRSRGIVAKS